MTIHLTTIEKASNMVSAFLNEDKDVCQVPTTKTGPEKVTNMVGTFLNEECDGLQIMKATTAKAE